METRVAVLGIIVEDPDSVAHLNEVLKAPASSSGAWASPIPSGT